MNRWIPRLGASAGNVKIDAFLEEVLRVCERHGFALSHEDQQGALQIVDWSKGDPDWLRDATDLTNSP